MEGLCTRALRSRPQKLPYQIYSSEGTLFRAGWVGHVCGDGQAAYSTIQIHRCAERTISAIRRAHSVPQHRNKPFITALCFFGHIAVYSTRQAWMSRTHTCCPMTGHAEACTPFVVIKIPPNPPKSNQILSKPSKFVQTHSNMLPFLHEFIELFQIQQT